MMASHGSANEFNMIPSRLQDSFQSLGSEFKYKSSKGLQVRLWHALL